VTRPVADLPPCSKCDGPLVPLLACNTCGYVSVLRTATEVDRFLACPECTAANEIQLLCDKCHARFALEAIPEPTPRPRACPSCATFLGPEDKECPTCGRTFEAPPTSTKARDGRRKRRIKGQRDDREAAAIRGLPGIRELQARTLLQQGYDAIWKLRRASEEELSRIPELGRAGASAVKAALRSVPHEKPHRPKEAVLDEELECPLCGCVTSAFSSTCLECGATFEEEEMDEEVRRSLVEDGEQGLLAFYDLCLQDEPNEAELWYARGLLLEAMGEDEEATRSLDHAASLSSHKKIAVVRTRLLSKSSHEPGVPDRLRSMLQEIVDETGLDEELKAFQQSLSDRGPTCQVCDEPLPPGAVVCPACSTAVGKAPSPPAVGKPPETKILDSLMDELSRPPPKVEPEPTTPASFESIIEKFEESMSPEEVEQTRIATLDWLMGELEESVTSQGEEAPSPKAPAPRPLATPSAAGRDHVSTRAGFLSKSLFRRQGLATGKESIDGRGRVNGYINGAGKVNGFINGRGRVNGFINGRGYVNGAGLTMVHLPTGRRRSTIAALGAGVVIALIILVALLPPPTGPAAPIVIDGSLQDWTEVPKFDAATPSTNPDVELAEYASFMDRDYLYLFARTRGATFADRVGYDGIFFLIDGDGDAATGFTFAGLGADAVVEVDGGNESVAAARLFSFPADAELNWSRREGGRGVSAAASASGLEVQVAVDNLLSFDEAAFRVAVYADDFDGASSRSEAPLSHDSGAILIRSRPLTTVIGAGWTDLLEIQVRALGRVPAGETWTVSAFQVNATSGLLVSLSAESVNLTRDLPTATIRVAVQAPGFLPGDVVGAEMLGAIGPRPVSVIREPAKAYVVSIAPQKRIDGLFEDWRVGAAADTDLRPVNNTNVDIERFGAARDGTTAFFYVQVGGDILGGSVPQRAVRVRGGVGGGGGSSNATLPPRQTGEDILRVYVDVNVSDGLGMPFEGILADVLLEVRGVDGRVTSRSLHTWSSSWTKVAAGGVDLAKNSTSIEGSLPIGATANGTQMVFAMTDWSGISDVTIPIVAVLQNPPPPPPSFSLRVNAPEFELIAAPLAGAILLGIVFLRRRRALPHEGQQLLHPHQGS